MSSKRMPGIPGEIDRVISDLVALMVGLSPDQRLMVIDTVEAFYCRRCGESYASWNKKCQCPEEDNGRS